jgi:hypothetical protein
MTIIVPTPPNSQGMTFLQLVARLRMECGATGADPVTLQGQLTTETARLAKWINTAWTDLQNARSDWKFMRTAFSFTATQAAGRSYTPAQAGAPLLANWKNDSLRAYAVALGKSNEQILPWLDYDRFRNLYLFGANASMQQRPIMFTVDPQNNLVLGPAPDADYVVSGEAFLLPGALVADTDYPSIPAQYHMILVYKAMMMYGRYENAPEVRQDGEIQYSRMLLELTIDQAPRLHWGGPLA